MNQLSFDLQRPIAEAGIVIDLSYTERFSEGYKRTAEGIVTMAQVAVEVRDNYGYQPYITWLKDSFGLGARMGDNLLAVHRNLLTANFAVDVDWGAFASSALYLLASPSTPESIRLEMVERAQNGETITYSTVKSAISPPQDTINRCPTCHNLYDFGIFPTGCPYCYKAANNLNGWVEGLPERMVTESSIDRPEFDHDSHLDNAPEEEEGDYNYKRDNRRATPSDIYSPQGNDACQTPPYAIDPLLPYLLADWLIWEPAAGEGFLVEALYDASRQVTSSDILDGRNFFEHEPDAWDCITTNPPFSITQQWLRRCYELGKPFALLIKVEALGTKGVQELIQQYGFEMMLLDKRIDFKMPFLGWGDEERKSQAQFPVFWLCWQLLPEKVMFGKIDKRGFNGQSD